MLLGDPDRPVQRDPALEPAVGEVLAAATRLPDALVGLIPVVAEPIGDLRQGLPALMGDRQPGLVPVKIESMASP